MFTESQGITISNMHLYFHPDHQYTRLRQAIHVLKELMEINREFNYPALMIGGITLFASHIPDTQQILIYNQPLHCIPF